MNINLTCSYVRNFFLILLCFGFLIFIAGIQVVPDTSKWHTQLYLLEFLPTLVLFFFGFAHTKLYVKSIYVKLLLFLFAYLLLSELVNQSGDTLKELKQMLLIFLFSFSIFYLIDKFGYEKVFFPSIVIASLFALISIAQFFFENKSLDTVRFIGDGVLSNPLLSSHYFGSLCVLALGTLFCAKDKKTRLVLLGCVIIFLLCSLLTKSRTTMVGLLGVVVIYIYLIIMNKKSAFLKWVALIIALFVLFFVLFGDEIISRGVSLRPEIWSASIDLIINKPLLGHGGDAGFEVFISKVNTSFYDPHNIHLAFAYHYGLIGLFLWISLLGVLSIACLRSRNSLIIYIGLPLLVYGAIAGLTEGGNIVGRPKEVWFLTWLPISIAIGLLIVAGENSKKLVNQNG
ncbi:O-antigen ligase family protein [Zooshikella ganghwensis]|uniref:O-antigen ligase family protein n=1 Tax=Zooshikella ganghwensis TaxID=202772 RepID=UPI00041C2C7D|nr:O-antigen ligase family protein [Zooshikella ganghwensis]